MKSNVSKPLGLLLAFALCLSGLTGCAGQAKETASTGVAAQTEKAPETTAAENASQTENAAKETTSAAASKEKTETEAVFAEWNPNAPSLDTLVQYVESVTDASSPDFVPVEDRIAVFDMDGTICGELYPTYFEYYMFAWRALKDPNFKADAEMKAVAEEIRAGGPTHTYSSDMAIRHATQAARAYAGMTLNEFADYVNGFLLREVDGFEGMTYGEAFYLPMIEVIEYLQDNDFKVYVCSGSDRFICRSLFEGLIDLPDEQIIGMDVDLEATGQDGKNGLDYEISKTDRLVRTDRLLIKNLKMNKVTAIAREIGKQPILSFGNSSGDTSMHLYTISNNPHKSAAFMLIADDGDRDYGHPEKGESLRKKWEDYGFTVISMKDDFRTIYGDKVKKTGKFRWTDELDPTKP